MIIKYKIQDFYDTILNQYKLKDNTDNIFCIVCNKQCNIILRIPISVYENILIIDGVCCGIECLNNIIKTDKPKYILTKNILISIFYPIM